MRETLNINGGEETRKNGHKTLKDYCIYLQNLIWGTLTRKYYTEKELCHFKSSVNFEHNLFL